MEMRAIKYVIATWQSPGTMFVTAQQFDGCYQEIPTGLTALGMTEKNRNMYRSPCHCEERSDVAIRSPIFGRFVNRPYDGQATLGPLRGTSLNEGGKKARTKGTAGINPCLK